MAMIYMKKNAIFTIVAKNYIGLAQILGKSVKKHHSDVDFFIFVADETNQLDIKQIDGILFAKHILMYNESEWIDMSFDKYLLMSSDTTPAQMNAELARKNIIIGDGMYKL